MNNRRKCHFCEKNINLKKTGETHLSLKISVLEGAVAEEKDAMEHC